MYNFVGKFRIFISMTFDPGSDIFYVGYLKHYSGVPNKRDVKTCQIRAMKDILATENSSDGAE